MSAYLELHVKGGGVALVEAGMIGAAIGTGVDAWKVGTPQAPTRVVLRGGEQIDVIDVSVGGLIGRIVAVKQQADLLKRESGVEVFVDWLRPLREGAEDEPPGHRA